MATILGIFEVLVTLDIAKTTTSGTFHRYHGNSNQYNVRCHGHHIREEDVATATGSSAHNVAMTTTSGTVVDPQPSTSHVITINGTAHPVRQSLTPGELAQLKQRATSTRPAAGRRRPNEGPASTYDIQRRPLPNIAEERL